jgi:hypothetical protein
MSRNSAEDGGAYNGTNNVEEPHIARLVAFLFLVSFVGMFAIMPFLEQPRHQEPPHVPDGYGATAHLINSMHTPNGANKQGTPTSHTRMQAQ